MDSTTALVDWVGPNRASVNLDPELIKQACLRAAEMLSGMGYTGKIGSFHLMDLNLQSNTPTAILHNLIAWEISRLDSSWTFHPKGGSTPDLTSKSGDGIQVKVTSDATIKGNYVSAGGIVRHGQIPPDRLGVEQEGCGLRKERDAVA